jgi:5-methyltetrahydrofolate--homocysteine methyltransferase
LVLDTTFDSSSNESQVFLHNFCEDLFAQDFASPVSDNFTCPLTRFVQWLEEQSQSATPLADYTQNCNNASSLPMDPASWDSCLIGWSQLEVEPSILSRNGKVTIVMVPFASRVRYDDYYDRLNDEWKLIENWIKTQNSNAPQGVNQGYFSSFDFWWYDTNGQMLSTAYSSAAMALGGAAAVIFFTSQSLVLTLYCTITLGYVLTSVTATLVAMGWTLGFVESICFAILIGVSVDFVIHFGHAYSMAAHGDADRGFRTRYALISMGPSILATALTTNLSAVIMFFTVITFFQKFAMILFLSVLQACIGSFFVFLTMADCIGPRNPTYFVDQLKRYWNRS